MSARGHKLTTRVSSHTVDTITINPGYGVQYIPGEVVQVETAAPGSVVSFLMQVMCQANGMGRGVVLRRNPNAMSNRNRRSWRIPVEMPISVKRSGAPHFIIGRLVNISMEGVQVVSPAALNNGDMVQLQLMLPDNVKCLLLGKVVRITPIAAPGQASNSTGILFSPLSRESRNALTYFIWKQIRERHIARKNEAAKKQ